MTLWHIIMGNPSAHMIMIMMTAVATVLHNAMELGGIGLAGLMAHGLQRTSPKFK